MMLVTDSFLKWTIVGIAIFIVVLLILYVYIWLTTGTCKSKARLDGKTVIITGCTAGIGKYTALDLARRGARLIMACRNIEKANAVRESIVAATNNDNVVVKRLDVSLLSSVRAFAEEMKETEPRLDVLIHNAGVITSQEKQTKEGLNTIWATNYFGPVLLTHLLLESLKRTQNSRIIMVSSSGHSRGNLDIDRKSAWGVKSDFSNYCDSKLAEILFINKLALQLRGTGVTANCLHPGCVATSICINEDCCLFKLLSWLFFCAKNVEKGSQTTIYLAVSEEVSSVTGKYFVDCKEKNPSRKTEDLILADYLWNMTEQIVQINPQTSTTS